MNNKQLFLSVGIVGLTLISCVQTQARHHIVVGDPFFDTGWIDSMMLAHQEMFDAYAQGFPRGASKEEREALKQAHDKVAKITHEIKEDDKSIKISLKGFEGLSKDDIKVIEKDNEWCGTITIKEGRIKFFLSPHGFQFSSHIELKREEPIGKDSKEMAEDKAAKRTYYSSFSSTFSAAVDLQTLKAEPVKADEFTLTVQKQKEKLLPIS